MAAHRCVVLVLSVAHLFHRLWSRVRLRAHVLPVPQTGITVSGIWLVVALLLVWAIAAVYVPVFAPFLRPRAMWTVALATTLLLGFSLLGHVWAHVGMARVLRSARPGHIPVYPFGDAAQVWPAGRTPLHEALVALSGPGFNLVVAYVAYRVWDCQVHVYSDAAMPLVAGINLIMAVLNMAPGFPMDGGRLTRVVVWGLLARPTFGSRLGRWMGYSISSVLACWGLVLLGQHARFRGITGISTLSVAMLLLWAVWRHQDEHQTHAPRRTFSPYSVRGLASSVLILGQFAIAGSLVPMTHGIRMPGVAVPIEPMIIAPDGYRHQANGNFLMTTVFEQTPIIAGQWVYAQLRAASDIVAPEQLVSHSRTPQEHMHHNYQLLEHSQQTATIVALRLAGFHTVVRGTVVEVVDIRPDSWASEALRPGDRILRLNGMPLHDSDDLFTQLRAHDPAMLLNLELVRNSTLLHLQHAFTPGTDQSTPPALVVRATAPYTDAPFAVMITPHKILGGPSVGLMFTLTVYNVLTPDDLTGGRRIAGTGTIDLDGRVGPIGGVAQKVAAAEAAGADYFLVPIANAADARCVARHIEIIEVATVEQAIELLRALPPAESQS